MGVMSAAMKALVFAALWAACLALFLFWNAANRFRERNA